MLANLAPKQEGQNFWPACRNAVACSILSVAVSRPYSSVPKIALRPHVRELIMSRSAEVAHGKACVFLN